MKILILLILSISCSSVKPKSMKAILNNKVYSIELTETEELIKVKTEITGNKEMVLHKMKNWNEKVFSGKFDTTQEYWVVENDSSYWIEEVLIAPFYSVYTNGFFQHLSKHPTKANLRPDCPLKTSKILVLFLGSQGFPIIACIIAY